MTISVRHFKKPTLVGLLGELEKFFDTYYLSKPDLVGDIRFFESDGQHLACVIYDTSINVEIHYTPIEGPVQVDWAEADINDPLPKITRDDLQACIRQAIQRDKSLLPQLKALLEKYQAKEFSEIAEARLEAFAKDVRGLGVKF